MTHIATIIQTRYKGTFVRTHDKLVMPAILALRAARLFEKRTNAATSIQCFWRQAMSISRLKWLRRDFISRRYSSRLIQNVRRSMIARKRMLARRMSAELYSYYCKKMATRIQCALRQYLARKELDKCLELAYETYLMEHKSARKIQSHHRGGLARQRVQNKRLEWNNATVEIQRIFRGTCVQRWQKLKMDAISKHVHEKADSELNAARIRRGHTSSSTESKLINDESDGPPLGTPGDEDLLKYVFGRSFVKLRCLIYWPDIGRYKSGSIADYDDRMRLWKIDYDGDDNEWLDLPREHQRLMIMGEKGTDWIPFNYHCPLTMVQYLEKRKTLEPSNSSSTAIQESKEQVISDIWYCSYVSRGLLDECYHTQSHESLHKLRSAHLVKALTLSIAKVKYIQRGTNNEELGSNEMDKFECLLSEVEDFLRF